MKSHRRSIRINGKLLSQRFSSKKTADEWLLAKQQERERVSKGLEAPLEKSMTFGVWAKTWIEQREKNYPVGTWKTDRDRLNRYILPHFSLVPLGSISAPEILKFLTNVRVQFNISLETTRRIKAVLSKVYNDAIAHGFARYNPVIGVRLETKRVAKDSKKAYKWWEDLEHIQRFMEATSKEENFVYIFSIIAVNTGMREGEVLGLQYGDINFETNVIRVQRIVANRSHKLEVRTKAGSGVGRSVPLNSSLKSILSSYMRLSPYRGNDCFFVTRDGYSSLNPYTIARAIRRVAEAANVPHIGAHGMRHTYASHFMKNGGNLKDLKEILGHSSTLVTERYAHLAKNHLNSVKETFSFRDVNLMPKID